jgi:hypothetical protein
MFIEYLMKWLCCYTEPEDKNDIEMNEYSNNYHLYDNDIPIQQTMRKNVNLHEIVISGKNVTIINDFVK